MKTIINVTQDDIDNGKPADYARCPVARALRRAFNDMFSVTGICIYNESKRNSVGALIRYLSPIAVTNFVIDFDSSKPVAPFSFELDIVD